MNQWAHVFECAAYDSNHEDYPLKGTWGEKVFGNDHPIVLELGCGKGEYTVALAEKFPDKNFIGIDIKGARMWTGAKESLEKKLKNVAFIRTHIEFLNRFFDRNEITEIWLTFPDPQMKKVRKRLTSTRFMAAYQQIVKPDGLIHLKTDSQFLFTYTLAMIAYNELPVFYKTDDLYQSGLTDSILSVQTFYEKQWLLRGISIKYIKFGLDLIVDWHEPDVDIEPDSYRSFGRSARHLTTKTEQNDIVSKINQ